MAKIKFQCCHRERGCKEVLTYADIFKHQSNCPTIIFRCPHCQYMGHTDSRLDHNCLSYLSDQLTTVSAENQRLKQLFD